MADKTIASAIIADVKRLISALRNENIRVERAILFGSHARGEAHEFSDIDVALVSPDFTGIRFDDNRRIAKIKLQTNTRFETHPFTEEDFEDSPFVRDEILRHGIEVV